MSQRKAITCLVVVCVALAYVLVAYSRLVSDTAFRAYLYLPRTDEIWMIDYSRDVDPQHKWRTLLLFGDGYPGEKTFFERQGTVAGLCQDAQQVERMVNDPAFSKELTARWIKKFSNIKPATHITFHYVDYFFAPNITPPPSVRFLIDKYHLQSDDIYPVDAVISTVQQPLKSNAVPKRAVIRVFQNAWVLRRDAFYAFSEEEATFPHSGLCEMSVGVERDATLHGAGANGDVNGGRQPSGT